MTDIKELKEKELEKVTGVTIDKLKKYYAGDEDPLRNNAFIYTTALSIGVNCSKKHIFAKFWENEKLIYEYNWD